MIKYLKYLVIAAAALMPLTGCRSKQAAAPATAPEQELTVEQWQNVQMPVRLTINRPMGMTLSGTATMVRNQYIYMSFRMFGFEVAQANLTPDDVDFVLRQPEKIWFKEALGNRLEQAGFTFEKLQQMLLNEDEYTLRTGSGNKAIDATLTWTRSDARWNVERPARFTAPGDNYRKMTLENAKQLLGK